MQARREDEPAQHAGNDDEGEQRGEIHHASAGLRTTPTDGSGTNGRPASPRAKRHHATRDGRRTGDRQAQRCLTINRHLRRFALAHPRRVASSGCSST